MHYCMHKSMEPLYRCTKVDERQFTPLEPVSLGSVRPRHCQRP